MGDALSTYFEARATHNSYSRVNASLPMGSREGLTPRSLAAHMQLWPWQNFAGKTYRKMG